MYQRINTTELILQINFRVSRVKFHQGTQRENARSVGRGLVLWGRAAGEMTSSQEGTKVSNPWVMLQALK